MPPEKKSPFKRSPLKGIANVFNGLRDKAKEKHSGWSAGAVGVNADRPRRFVSLDEDSDWFSKPRSVGSGLPGGIVFSDRMGDAEMAGSSRVDDGVSKLDSSDATCADSRYSPSAPPPPSS